MLELFVVVNSIFVNGRVSAILRTPGLVLSIWVMLLSWCVTLSVVCSSLGRLEPEGGVVLGHDIT